ncbi:hypothetical protein [Streptomyces sp. NPDC002671]
MFSSLGQVLSRDCSWFMDGYLIGTGATGSAARFVVARNHDQDDSMGEPRASLPNDAVEHRPVVQSGPHHHGPEQQWTYQIPLGIGQFMATLRRAVCAR